MAQSSAQAKSQAGAKAWFGNAMKSVGKASVASFKKIAPNISSAGTGMYEGGKKVRSSLKPSNLISISRDLTRNKYVKLAKKTLNQSIADIKSGNLFNEGRAEEAYLNGGGFGGDDDFDFSGFGDDDDFGGGDNYFINESSGNDGAATFALTSAMAKSAEATVAVGNAMVDSMTGLSSAMISEIQSGFGEMTTKLDGINSTLGAILEFQNQNTTKFYETVLGAIERMTPPVKESVYTPDNNPMAMFGSKGGLSFSSYKDYIKKQMKKVVEDSPVGMVMGMLDDQTLEMLFADPVGGLTNTIVTAMVPNVVERTLKTVDKTLGDLEQNALLDLGKWAKDPSKNMVQQIIGSIFGIKPEDVSRNTSMAAVNKDAAVFDNITRNTIVEVLPKYARESTAYLKEIATHITKKDQNAILGQSDVFDAQNNRYVKQDKLMQNFLKDMVDGITTTFKSSEFGQAMSSVSGNLSGKDRESFDNALNQFIAKMATSDHNFTYRDFNVDDKNSPIYKLLKNTGTKQDRGLIREAIKYMYDNGQAGGAAKAQQDARSAWNSQVKDISENFDSYNLHALGIDNNTDLVKMILEYQQGATKQGKGKVRGSRKLKNAYGSRQKMSDLVGESISGWEAGNEMFGDNKLSGGQIAGKIFGADFGGAFAEMGGHANNAMLQIMRGNAQGAMSEFGKIFTSQMKNMWEGTKTHFIKPLTEKLYGKDADGNAVGLFAGARNKLDDAYKAIVQKINGKSYEDSEGNLHEAEKGTSLVDKAADVFNTIKGSVVSVLFGDKTSTDADGNPIDAKKGLFTTITETMKAGVTGWKEAVFGESEDPDKEVENLKQKALDHMPSAIMGSAGGAVVGAMSAGSLFGTLIGGPVGGAAIGFATSFLAKSDKFKDYLFGPEVEDEDGNKSRVGGFISASTQKAFKENKNSIIGGAAIGALKSMVFPNGAGLLGSIVGGPIAGAAIGAGVGMLKKSEAFQKFLYGDEEKGKEGVISAFKKMFGGKGGNEADPEMTKENMKAVGMGITGAGAGALSAALIGKMGILGAMATPAGPLGAAIVGASVGIAAGSRKFREFLFGKKDPETGDKKGGLFQKFGNFLHVEVLSPMKSKVQNLVDDAMITFKYDILENVRLPFTILANHFSEAVGDAKKFVSEKVGNAIEFVFVKVISPVIKIANKFIFAPARKILGKTADILYNFGKAVVTAPFKMIRAVGRAITSPFRKAIHKVTGYIKKGVGFIVKKTTAFIGGAFNLISKPFRFVGNKLKNLFTGIKDRAAEKYSGGGGGIRGLMYRAGAALTSSEWRKGDYTNQADKREAKAKAKADARKRSIADYNRRLVAKELGYNVKYFTEDTMNEAIEHAKLNKRKLKFRGNGIGQDVTQYFDTDPAEVAKKKRAELMGKSTADIARTGDKSEDMDVRQLSEQYRTNQTLEHISDAFDEMLGRGDENDLSDEEREELHDQMRAEARRMGFDYDPETGKFTARDDMFDHAPGEGGTDDEEKSKERKSFSEWVRGIKSDVKEGYQGSWLQGMVNKGKGLFGRGGQSLDDVIDEAASSGHTRAAGGPINEGEPYIVGEGGNDTSGAELIVPRQSGTVLAQGGNGIKVQVTEFDSSAISQLQGMISTEDTEQESILMKTLTLVEDLAGNVPVIGDTVAKVAGLSKQMLEGSQFDADVANNGFMSAVKSRIPFGRRSAEDEPVEDNFSGFRFDDLDNIPHRAAGGAVARNQAYLVGDGGTDPQAEEIFVPQTSGRILSQGQNGLRVVVAGFENQAQEDLEEVEFEGPGEKSGGIIASMREANSYAVMKQRADELKEQESDNAREEKMLETLESIRDRNTEHHNIWNSIFSKKGIITMGAIAVGAMLLKYIPKIIDWFKKFKGIFDNISGVLEWFNNTGAGDGGKGIGGLLFDKLGQLGKSALDIITGNIGGGLSEFILDNGKWDANSGGRVSLLANLLRKPLKKGIKVGSAIVKGAKTVGKGVVKGAKAVGKGVKSIGSTLSKGFAALKNKFGKKAGEAGVSVIDNATGEIIERVSGDVVMSNMDDAAVLGGRALLGTADDAATLALPGMLDDGTRILATGADDVARIGTNSVDDIAKAGTKLIGTTGDDAAKFAANSVDDFIEGSVRAFGTGTAHAASGVAEGAEAVTKASKGMVGKVVSIIDDFIKGVLKKLGAKMPKALTEVSKKVGSCVSKFFNKIAAKISAIFGGKTAAEIATLGLSTAVFCTVGAINGATGAARLFKVDKKEVDATMVLISTAMGALVTGTTIGSIIDVVSGLVYEIMGFDLLGTVALLAYQALVGEQGAAGVMAAQEEWRAEFEKYQGDAIENEMNTQKAAGLIGQDVTIDQFREGLKTGQYHSSVQSFQDWNADQNQSLGYKAGKAITNGFKGVKKFFGGSTAYTDESTGNQYIDNGDGTLTVIGKDGVEIGKVSKDAVNTAGMNADHKKGVADYVGDAWNTTKEAVNKAWKTGGKIVDTLNPVKNLDRLKKFGKWLITAKNEEVYVSASDLSYYTGDGKHFSSTGDDLGDSIDLETLSTWVASGMLTPEIKTTQKSGAQKILATFGKKLSDLQERGNSIREEICAKFNQKLTDMKNNFLNFGINATRLFNHKEAVWELNDGSGYYKVESATTVALCGPDGSIISEGIPIDELKQQIEIGAVHSEKINVQGNWKEQVSSKISSWKESLHTTWDSLLESKDKILASFKETSKNVLTKVSDFAVGAARLVSTSEKVWMMNDGSGYYRYSSGGMWQKYTSDGDAIEGDELSTADLRGVVDNGLVTLTTVPVKSVIGSKLKQLFEIRDNAFKAQVENKLEMFKGIAKAVSPIVERVKKEGLIAGLTKSFNKVTKKAWWTLDMGGYYMMEGDGTWQYYTINNDKVEGKTLTAKEFADLQASGSLTEGEVTRDSEASKALNDVKSAVKNAWAKSKDIAKNKWKSFTEWLGIGVSKEDVVDNSTNAVTGNGSTASIGGNGRGKKPSRGRFGGKGGDTLNGAAYFSQDDPRWANLPYIQQNTEMDDSTISDSGCGPVSMAMVARQLGQGGVTPVDMANIAIEGGYRDQTGTNERYVDYAAAKMGFSHTDVYSPSADYIQTEAAQGRPVLLNGISSGDSSSAYTDNGHYVVAVGADEAGNVLVNDPRGPEYSTIYNAETLASQTRKAWSFGSDSMVYGGNGRGSRFGGRGAIALGDTADQQKQSQAAISSTTKNRAAAADSLAKKNALSSAISGVANAGAAIAGTLNGGNEPLDPNNIDYARKVPSRTVNPDGTIGDWIEIIRIVKALVAAQKPTYWAQGQHNIKISYDGHIYTVRPDCSGIIACMLWIYGVLPEGTNVTSALIRQRGFLPKGFTMMDWPGWENLQEGDIIAKVGHVEIFANNEGGHYVYNGGSTKSLGTPGPSISGGGNYTVVWRPNYPGNGGIYSGELGSYNAVVDGTATDTTANTATTNSLNASTSSGSNYGNSGGSITFGSSAGSTGADGDEEEPEKLSFMDKISKVGSIFSKLGSKALSGVLLNDWDYDFSDKTESAGSSDSSGSSSYSASSSSSGSSEMVGGAATLDYGEVKSDEVAPTNAVNVVSTAPTPTGAMALQGATEKEKIYNFLRGRGYNPAAAASIMGCWEVESGNKAARVEGDYLKNFWGYDKVLDSNQTMNAYTSEFLFPAYKRSNMSINQSGYKHEGNYYPGVGLAQWTGVRGQKLFNYAKEKNMKWGGLDTQLSYFDSEMEGNYKGVKNALSAVKNVESGTETVLDGYEMSKGYSKKAPKAYEKRLTAAKAIYNQFGGKGQSNKSADIPGKYPTVNTSTGRLGATQTSSNGSTVYNVTQSATDLTYVETMLKKLVKLIDSINETITPIKKFDDQKNSIINIDKNITNTIMPSIDIIAKAAKTSIGTTVEGSGAAAGGATGAGATAGGGTASKNGAKAGAIAKG